MIILTEDKKNLLASQSHILATGGPGSGKTTIALMKAGKIVSDNFLKPAQCILFLSFARATVARVAEQAIGIIEKKDQDKIEINTYHGFAWKLIRSYGFLLSRKPIRLLPPSDAASRLSKIDSKNKLEIEKEKQRLFTEEGFLHFDLFASKSGEILSGSSKIRTIISDSYPIIILDEFQDTNTAEWAMIQLLGEKSTLIALADLEQRIYDFRGASPSRIKNFCEKYSPEIFDFGLENHRSPSTDIVTFGNDLLTGKNKGKQYNDVVIERYTFSRDHMPIKSRVISVMNQLKKQDKEDWTLQIQCYVHFGTLEGARWFAVTAYKTHDLRRTNEDKRKTVKMALLHPKGVEMSNSKVAEDVSVSCWSNS